LNDIISYKGFTISSEIIDGGAIARFVRESGQPIVLRGVRHRVVATAIASDEEAAILDAKVAIDRIMRGWFRKKKE